MMILGNSHFVVVVSIRNVSFNTNFSVHLQDSPFTEPIAQSTPQPPSRRVDMFQNYDSLWPDLDLGDDNLFDTEGVHLPESMRQHLDGALSRLDPNVSENIRRVGDSLNQVEGDRVRPLDARPNEDQPIRPVSLNNYSCGQNENDQSAYNMEFSTGCTWSTQSSTRSK